MFVRVFNKYSHTRQRTLAFQLMANYALHRTRREGGEITGSLYVESKLLREFKETVLRKFSNIERIDLWFFRIYETIQDGADVEICQESVESFISLNWNCSLKYKIILDNKFLTVTVIYRKAFSILYFEWEFVEEIINLTHIYMLISLKTNLQIYSKLKNICIHKCKYVPK